MIGEPLMMIMYEKYLDFLGLKERYSLHQNNHESPILQSLLKAQMIKLDDMVEHSLAINEVKANMKTSIMDKAFK